MKRIGYVLLYISLHTSMNAQITLPLWPEGKVPNYKASGEKEKIESADIMRVSLVQTPEMTVYLPSKKAATGQAGHYLPGRRLWFLSL
jgi:hypothetical protein